jgi:hypothetical protein
VRASARPPRKEGGPGISRQAPAEAAALHHPKTDDGGIPIMTPTPARSTPPEREPNGLRLLNLCGMSGDRLTEVITRAAGLCQCRAGTATACGRPHKPTGGACIVAHTPQRPLHIVPRTDIRPEHAAILPAEAFTALCDACHAALLAVRRKARARAVPVPEALF